MTLAKRRAGYFLSGLAFTFLTLVSYAAVQPPQTCVPPPLGMVSWWPGDGNANDIADGNHGTLQNGAAFATGLVSQAFSFDGVDDFVEVPNSPSLMIAGTFTVEFWFNLNATYDSSSPASPGFFSKGFFDSINLANNDGRLEVRGPVPRPNSTTNTWLAGIWYHVAVTYNSLEYKVYINGAQEGGILSSHSILNNADNIAIGSIPAFLPGAVTTNGLIDEMTIYNRALTASEIQAIFDAGGAGKCKDTDGDGVPDSEDECPSSIIETTVVIAGCNSGVPNTVFPNGCTVSDKIQQCITGAGNHGQFVSCVAHLTNELKKAGLITGQQKRAIQRCAAQANIP